MTYPGLYRAVVVDNGDPEDRLRLRVRVPSVTGTAVVGWVWPCLPSLIGVQPPIPGAGVFVQYEAGDPDFPVWVGVSSAPASGGTASGTTFVVAPPPAPGKAATFGIGQAASQDITVQPSTGPAPWTFIAFSDAMSDNLADYGTLSADGTEFIASRDMVVNIAFASFSKTSPAFGSNPSQQYIVGSGVKPTTTADPFDRLISEHNEYDSAARGVWTNHDVELTSSATSPAWRFSVSGFNDPYYDWPNNQPFPFGAITLLAGQNLWMAASAVVANDITDLGKTITLSDAFVGITPLMVGVTGTGDVVLRGDKGDPGPAGPAGTVTPSEVSYVHTQGIAASTWTITHNLGFYPNVTVVDSSGAEVEGATAYPDANTMIITFSAAFGGVAYLS